MQKSHGKRQDEEQDYNYYLSDFFLLKQNPFLGKDKHTSKQILQDLSACLGSHE